MFEFDFNHKSDIYLNSVIDRKLVNPFANNFHKAKERYIASFI